MSWGDVADILIEIYQLNKYRLSFTAYIKNGIQPFMEKEQHKQIFHLYYIKLIIRSEM